MTEEQALLAAVIADRADDTVRLAYADWLYENGRGERAEFIRVQCRLAALGCSEEMASDCKCEGCVAARSLVGRDVELLRSENAGAWFGSIEEWTENHTIHRGFVTHVTCSAADWLAHADALHWHPSQTDECAHCLGRRPGDRRAHEMNHPCRVCWGQCKFPRPCPETAQPLEKVKLTTRVEWAHRNGKVLLHDSGIFQLGLVQHQCRNVTTDDHPGDIGAGISYVAGVLAAEWPGVTFELSEALWEHSDTVAVRRQLAVDLEAMREAGRRVAEVEDRRILDAVTRWHSPPGSDSGSIDS